MGLVQHLKADNFSVVGEPLVGPYLSFGSTSRHGDHPVYPPSLLADILRLVLTAPADPQSFWPVDFELLKSDFSQGCEQIDGSERAELTLGRGAYAMDGPTSGMAHACCCTTAAAPCQCSRPRRVAHRRSERAPGLFVQLDLVRPGSDPRFTARLMLSIADYNATSGVSGARTGFAIPKRIVGTLAGIERWLEKPSLVTSKSGTKCSTFCMIDKSPAEKRAIAQLTSQRGKDKQDAVAAHVGGLLAACAEAETLSRFCLSTSLECQLQPPHAVSQLLAESAHELVAGAPMLDVHVAPDGGGGSNGVLIATGAARRLLPQLRTDAAALDQRYGSNVLATAAAAALEEGRSLASLLGRGHSWGQQQMNMVPGLVKRADVRRAERRASGAPATVAQRIGSVSLQSLRQLAVKARKAGAEGMLGMGECS